MVDQPAMTLTPAQIAALQQLADEAPQSLDHWNRWAMAMLNAAPQLLALAQAQEEALQLAEGPLYPHHRRR